MTNTSSWSYAENGFGPRCWHERYKIAKGNLQSPINIETAQAKEGNSVGPVQFKYISIRDSTITNDGRQLRITLTRNESVVTGGPLTDRYQLAVIRFHWGNDNCSGSEHSVDGRNYPLEVQLIHWNADVYKNIGEAITGENGICIIGLLYQVTDEDNEGLAPVIKLLSRDENKGCFSLEVKSAIDPNKIIADMNSYWTYQGSLTTPPLSENVTWLISQNIMGLSEKQMNVFRSIRNSVGESMADHCRPACPLNDRPVLSCACVVKSTSMENNNEVDSGVEDKEDLSEEIGASEENENLEEINGYNDGAVDNVDADEGAEKGGKDENTNQQIIIDDNADTAMNDQDANFHGNQVISDVEDDTETVLYDENANRHASDEKSGTVILDDGLLELMNKLAE